MIMIVFVETFREVLILLYIHKCKSVEAVEFLSIQLYWKVRNISGKTEHLRS